MSGESLGLVVRKSVNYSFECCVKRSLQSIAPNVAKTELLL